MTAPVVVVHPDADALAKATAARLLLRLLDAQSLHSPVHVVLTGGGMGGRVLAEVASSPLRDAVDWTGVHVWWGDERFLPPGDPERNETQARRALLDHVPVDPARVRPMRAAAAGVTAEEAAAAYAAELRRAVRPADPGPAPAFDVLLLGMGPDAHVASLFPGMPALDEAERPVAAVHGAPKPPPTRITLTFPAIRCAREVWVVAAGAEKAEAAALALSGAEPRRAPAAAVRGREGTLFLLDRAAAHRLPPGLARAASP